MVIVLIIAAGVAVLGVGLAAVGWVGRRLGDHPVCRRCGFDLFGKPDGSRNCPECGADLDARRAIVTGIRTKRPWALMAGAALLVPGLSVAALVGCGVARGIAWEPHQPSWWLARQAQGRDPIARDAALAELLTRFAAGDLSDARVNDLVERGLAMQAQLDRPWALLWGDVIEQARGTKHVTDAQWERYARQAIDGTYSIKIRPTLRPNDPVVHTISRFDARTARWTRLFAISAADVIVDDVTLAQRQPVSGFDNLNSQTTGSVSTTLNQSRMAELEAGPHEGYLRVRIQLGNDAPPPPPSSYYSTDESNTEDRHAQAQAYRDQMTAYNKAVRARLFTETEVRVPFQIELLAAGQPLGRPIADEKLRPRVKAALAVYNLHCTPTLVRLLIRGTNPPVDLCFDVSVRNGSKEWPVGKIAFPRGQRVMRSVTGQFNGGDGPTGKVVDIVLRPSDDAAALLLEGDVNYFDGEIVLEDVRVSAGPRLSE